MDPKVTLQMFLQAIADRDISAMRDSAADLRRWIAQGGFVPAEVHKCIEALQ